MTSPGATSLLADLSNPDRRTLRTLIRVVETLGADSVSGPLARLSSHADAIETLVALVAGESLDALPGGITSNELHRLLVEVRRGLHRFFLHVRPPDGGASQGGKGSSGETVGSGDASGRHANGRSHGDGDVGSEHGHHGHHGHHDDQGDDHGNHGHGGHGHGHGHH